MPDDSLLAGRTVAPSKPDNGTSRNSSGLSTDLVKIYKVCEFSIPSTFYYRFGVKRNPRTIAGIMPNGKLLLVAVDGHKPGYSVGASFKEEAAIMVSRGEGGRQPRRQRLDNDDCGQRARQPPIRRSRRKTYR
jgi:hypothetical protein